MNDHSMKRFKLAIAIPLSLGLGMARVLPVEAAAIAKPTAPSPSHSQPLDGYQFKLDGLALSSTAKPMAKVAQTALEPPTWSADTPAPKAPQTAKGDAANNQEEKSSDGFFALVIFATVLAIIYNLISRGKSAATVSPPGPKTGQSSPEAAAIAETKAIAPPALEQKASDEPTAVPTPALLPGLLGLSLKLFRQKKTESQTAAL